MRNFIKGLFICAAICSSLNASAQKNYKAVPSQSGLEYIKVLDKDGRTPNLDDIIKVNIIAYLEDSVVFNSQSQVGKPLVLKMAKPGNINDLMEGYQMMSKGDKFKFKVLSDILFKGGQKPPNVQAGDMIYWDVEMVDIMTAAEKKAEEEAQAKASKIKNEQLSKEFLSKSNLNFTTTPSGLKYAIRKKGNGAQILNGQTAVMNYTGRLLDGTVFDSNVDPKFNHVKPFEFILGAGQVIRGWDEGIAKLKVGDEATLYIPADIAYGAQARPSIPANSTLIFEVKLLSVKKNEAIEVEEVLEGMD